MKGWKILAPRVFAAFPDISFRGLIVFFLTVKTQGREVALGPTPTYYL